MVNSNSIVGFLTISATAASIALTSSSTVAPVAAAVLPTPDERVASTRECGVCRTTILSHAWAVAREGKNEVAV